MTTLIRSTEAKARVRTLPALNSQAEPSRAEPDRQAAPEVVSQPAPDPELVAAKAAVERLSAEIEDLRRRLHEAEQDAPAAHARGVEEGREQGVRSVETTQRQSLEALSTGVREALAAQSLGLAALERLAVQIAEHALARILGDQSRHAAMVAEIVRHQSRLVAGEAILRVEVSAADFPSGAEEIVRALGRSDVEVTALDQLAAGACRFQLRLGELDADLVEQWRRMSALLARAEAAP